MMGLKEKSLLELLEQEKELVKEIESLKKELEFLSRKRKEERFKETCENISNRYQESMQRATDELLNVRKGIKEYWNSIMEL